MTGPTAQRHEVARPPYRLDPMPLGRAMTITDERLVRAPPSPIFDIARRVELWPGYLPHYRYVRFRERTNDGGGLVEMAAWRPVGPLPGGWPTWWLSRMAVDEAVRSIRYRHVRGITAGMEVEWTFHENPAGTLVRIVHAWDGPRWPLIGVFAATAIIGPHFISAIASRTLDGVGSLAERSRRRR